MKQWRSALRSCAWLAAASPDIDGFRRFPLSHTSQLTSLPRAHSVRNFSLVLQTTRKHTTRKGALRRVEW
eukprot:6606690-Prymnesium_polylepis.1